MNLLAEALQWLFSPERLEGSNAIPLRLEEHLFYTSISVIIAALIAVPLGFYIGHTGKGRDFAVGLSGAARALPSFGLILLLVLLIGVTSVQLQLAAITAFVLLAIPSILAGAYAGIEAVDRRVIDSARAVGMTEWQILWKVEVPLGLPLLIGGLRAATLQVVATATLAAYVGLGGLGIYIFRGLPLQRYDEMLGSALLIAALALVLDGVFALLQQFAIPRGVSAGRAKDVRTSSPRRRPVAAKVAQERRG
ncbi:ABC transporter permease subunit [Salinibacterium sp. NSLL150]|uniref:ABC transporter permease n=1 Tax=unclassified Salinibacterium TaxID=2632331 RepID=UPI0018CD57A3|nr:MULTISPECIES: ABC transporter permease subunit [unclassified Salinibacterium]MBH0098892.1 ABC transporter permease subunit [Salinibacterium sp. NSLL35]MBH0101647.1 ABC transporter permease subunit [Salinibacterium sp. NSLL150]MBH0104406.1 ABC transporter permease subunit [Salinibacterium sp. NSLL16]MBH0107167.1 ABC transporter permease subunit [Salinibacterium sp. NSLL17]MBH0109053.1 ABC transporter permease subunit [Salinibacterium sp. NG22]